MVCREFQRKLTARYLAPFILAVGVLTALVLWRIQSQISTVDWVEHSDQVIERTKDAELQMRRIQLATRAYLFAPDKRFLDEVSDGEHEFARNLARVAALVADNPEQEDRLLQISDLKETWIGTEENLIRLKDSGKLDLENSPQNRPLTQKLFGALENFIAAEYQLRALRKAQQTSQTRLLFVLVPLLSAIVMIFLSYWGWRQIQHMPNHDGYFLARELRNREQTAGRNGRLPLIALTAYARVEDKVKIFEAGFDNHIVKPVQPAELSAILATVITSRRI